MMTELNELAGSMCSVQPNNLFPNNNERVRSVVTPCPSAPSISSPGSRYNRKKHCVHGDPPNPVFGRFYSLVKTPDIFELQAIRENSIKKQGCYCRCECTYIDGHLKEMPLDTMDLMRCPVAEDAPFSEVSAFIDEWIFERDVPLAFYQIHPSEWVGYLFERHGHSMVRIELVRERGRDAVWLVVTRLSDSAFVAARGYYELCKRLSELGYINEEEIPFDEEGDSSDFSYSSDGESEDDDEENEDYVMVDNVNSVMVEAEQVSDDEDESDFSDYLRLWTDDRLINSWVNVLKHGRNATDVLSIISLISHNSELPRNVEVMRRNPDLIACILHVLKEENEEYCYNLPMVRYCVKAIENMLTSLEDDLTWEATETLIQTMIQWSSRKPGFSWKEPVTYSAEIQVIVANCIKIIAMRKNTKKEQGSFTLRDVLEDVECLAQSTGVCAVRDDLDCFLQILDALNSDGISRST